MAKRGRGANRSKKRGKRKQRDGARREWIGGRRPLPFTVMDPGLPHRPPIILWVELPSGLIVGNEVVPPENEDGAVGRVLREALERPAAGPRRRPHTIRVDDPEIAAELRAVVGETIPVVVAPTPELDDILKQMRAEMSARQAPISYFEGGRIPPAAVERMFQSAHALYQLAPWEAADDDQVLRMDIPALGVEGACVSIIGGLGEELGVLVFSSLDDYETFLQRSIEILDEGEEEDFDLGTGWLALSFEHEDDLPASMLREVQEHGWSVAAEDAYPVVDRRERDGTSVPLVERDLQIASACASALTAFFLNHEDLFDDDDEFEPVCESYHDEDDLEVRFTLPYEAFPYFDVPASPADATPPPPAPGRAVVGRNDPCPCGSGRKYKKCHLPVHEQERAARRRTDPRHELDRRLVLELTEFGMVRLGLRWRDHTKPFRNASEARSLAMPWSVYGHAFDGSTVLDRFLEEHGEDLPRAEREWLEAQRAAWLSVWEVIDVDPGATLTLRDLLSGETREVRETEASKILLKRNGLLGRVVDHGDDSLLCGVHPRPLPPYHVAEVVRRARGRLRRKSAVPVARLRDPAFGGHLIRRWEEAVEKFDALSGEPPALQNTEGDPFLLTVDHYEIEPGVGGEVEERIAALEGVEPPEPEDDAPAYVFLRKVRSGRSGHQELAWGAARFTGSGLRLETNSIRRADELRRRVERACGKRIRHLAREHADPLSEAARSAKGDARAEPPAPKERQLLLDFKERHYRDWIDEALPALGGKTPREAVKTAAGRAEVDLLLKDMESHEQRLSPDEAFDFGKLRRKLRLE